MIRSKLLVLTALLFMFGCLSCGLEVKTVEIGNQVWMAKNLNVDHFRNGDPIPEARTNEEWIEAGENEQPAWCYYDNDPAYGKLYGKLYNWYAVDDSRGLAPEGWHVPRNSEWRELEEYVGIAGEDDVGWILNVQGEMLKEAGTQHWASPNEGATNESKFTALPSGVRAHNGNFSGIDSAAFFWTSTGYSTDQAWNRILRYDFSGIGRTFFDKQDGFSVRCVKENE